MLLKPWSDKSQSILTHSSPVGLLSCLVLCVYCINPLMVVLYEKAFIESDREHTREWLILAGSLHSFFSEPQRFITVQCNRLSPSSLPVQRDFPNCLVILECIRVCVSSVPSALLYWPKSKPLRSQSVYYSVPLGITHRWRYSHLWDVSLFVYYIFSKPTTGTCSCTAYNDLISPRHQAVKDLEEQYQYLCRGPQNCFCIARPSY